MGWFSRKRSRTWGSDGVPTKLDREGTRADLVALEQFVASRTGVEFYLEPETTATDTTVVAIAHDGEWIRRRTRSPRVAAELARRLALPLYEAAKMGYPERMRAWNRAHPERRLR